MIQEFKVSKLMAGMYTVAIFANDKMYQYKFIKNPSTNFWDVKCVFGNGPKIGGIQQTRQAAIDAIKSVFN